LVLTEEVNVTARKDYKVSWKQFIIAWRESESLDEVSKKLDMPKAQCAARAADYRKLDVPLKNFSRPKKPKDRQELEQFAQEMREILASSKTEEEFRERMLEHGRKEFCETWNSSTSFAAAAKKMGMTKTFCAELASEYRKRGSDLKEFPDEGGPPDPDVTVGK
jgi:hypothetical protein